jgi:hypothetical protein
MAAPVLATTVPAKPLDVPLCAGALEGEANQKEDGLGIHN